MRLVLAVVWVAVLLPVASASGAAVYVPNAGGSNVSQFGLGSGGGLASLGAAAPAGAFPVFAVTTPDGRSAYASNFTGDTVSQYDVAANGALTPKAVPTVPVTSPYGIAVTPDGGSAYVADQTDRRIYQFTVGAGGNLMPKSPAFVGPFPTAPQGVAVAPDGKTAYAAFDGAPGFVDTFVIHGDGTLAVSAPPATAGSQPDAIVVAPDGKHVFVTNFGGGSVQPYEVNPGGGLNARSPATVGGNPQRLQIAPDGRSLYVPNINGTVAQFDVGDDGTLTPKSPPTVTIPGTPNARGVAVSTGGHSVYVGGGSDNRVWQFSVGSGGTLTPKTPAFVSAGASPFSVTAGTDQGPTASFTVTPDISGKATRFDASASSDPDDGVARYDWDFGDGSTAPDGGVKPTHVYTSNGPFTATLRVTDAGGCSSDSIYTGQSFTCRGSGAAVATQRFTLPVVECACAPPPPLCCAPPSSAFTFVALSATRGGTITAVIDTQAAGAANGTATARVSTRRKRKRAHKAARTKVVAYGTGSATASGPGRTTLRIPATRSAISALHRARKLPVSVAITFNAGGPEVTNTRSVTVKAVEKRKKKRKR